MMVDYLHTHACVSELLLVLVEISEKGCLMDTQPTPVSERRGTPGLDIFKIAGQSISGFLPSFKTGSVSQVRQPFTSQLEERLAMYLEYHPHVRSYQRGDASEAFARARHLHTPLGTPYRIAYLYDGDPH